MKGINHTMKPTISRHRDACTACCIRNTVTYNHQNYCYSLCNINPCYALSVYLSICLSVYLSICLSVYQKHNYLALYCQLIDSLCYLFPVIFLFKKSAIFFGQSIFSKNTTGTSTFFRFCLSSHTLKRRSDMKPKSRAS